MTRAFPRFVTGALALALTALAPASASAWDPSSTHQGMLEEAVVRSAMHLRWMDASELERGLFTELRVDPALLDAPWLRLLELTVRAAHADVGARPLGGPGACPSAGAPPQTQRFCVDRDVWEHEALGWIRLGMIAEVTPSARHLHHFLDRQDPSAAQWSDAELPPGVLRRRARSSGEPLAGIATRTNFSGKSSSALSWLEDPDDLLAPAQTYRHLDMASRASTQAERDHYLALGLIGVGALLHVVQDLSVPAHARGDVSAFYAPLSPAAGDRGLPLQEFVRLEYGRRALPGLVATTGARPAGDPLSATLLGHILGDAQTEGVASLASRHFFSESSVPEPRIIPDTLSASEAAKLLLGDAHHLANAEVEGAILTPWPAGRGYLLSPTGRALAAFDTDGQGRIRAYLDETCYRDQALQLIPAAVDTSRSLLDLLWPAWPEMERAGETLSLTIPAWASAQLRVYVQDEAGERRELSTHVLEVEATNTVPMLGTELAAGERLVLVLSAVRSDGPPITLEQMLVAAPLPAAEPEPAPEPEAPAAESDPAAELDPAAADSEPAAADSEPTEPAAAD